MHTPQVSLYYSVCMPSLKNEDSQWQHSNGQDISLKIARSRFIQGYILGYSEVPITFLPAH